MWCQGRVHCSRGSSGSSYVQALPAGPTRHSCRSQSSPPPSPPHLSQHWRWVATHSGRTSVRDPPVMTSNYPSRHHQPANEKSNNTCTGLQGQGERQTRVSHLVAIVGPAAKLEGTMLDVEGEVLDIHSARALEGGRRLPVYPAVWLQPRFRYQRHLVVTVSATSFTHYDVIYSTL